MKKLLSFLKHHKKLIFIPILLIVAVGVFFTVMKSRAKKNTVMASVAVSTTELKKRDLSTSVSVTGTIASAAKREVTTDQNDVEVKSVFYEEGDYVEAGTIVIELDDSTLQDALEDAQDDYESVSRKQQQNLEKAQDSVEDAEKTYNKGTKEQESLVSDALSEYTDAKEKEQEKLSEYEKAKKKTEKAKTAYEEQKEKKKELKSAMNKASKAEMEKQAALTQAQEAYELAEANVKYADENSEDYASLNEAYTTAYSAYLEAEKEAEAASKQAEMAKKEYEKIEETSGAYEEAKKAEEEALNAYQEAVSATGKQSSQYEKALTTQADTNEKNADNLADSKKELHNTSLDVSDTLQDQKELVEKAKENLSETSVTAPISGYITAINVESGDTVSPSQTLFVIQDMEHMVVEASVDEYDIASLQKGQKAVIKTDATGEEELQGELTYVALTPESSSVGSAGSGSQMGGSSTSSDYAIQITLTDANERLRIGMTAKTSIILESAEDVFAVPYDCIETDKEGNSYITVMSEDSFPDFSQMQMPENGEKPSKGEMPSFDGKPGKMPSADSKSGQSSEDAGKRIQVETGIESDYYVEIISDELKEGMQVVTPQTVNSSSSSESGGPDGFGFSGMPGGIPSGGMSSGGGRPSGGMPSGGPR